MREERRGEEGGGGKREEEEGGGGGEERRQGKEASLQYMGLWETFHIQAITGSQNQIQSYFEINPY
jgi:hypothetical protein